MTDGVAPGADEDRPPRRRGVAVVVLCVGIAVLAAVGLATAGTVRPAALLTGGATADATVAQEVRFGGEAIVVSIRGELQDTISPDGATTLARTERRIARLTGVHAVYGPGSFLTSTITRLKEVRPGARLPGIGRPALSNRAYLSAVVLGRNGAPKQRFRWLFPDGQHARIVIRPTHDADTDRVLQIVREVRRLTRAAAIPGAAIEVGGPGARAATAAHDGPARAVRVLPLAALLTGLVLLAGLRRPREAAVRTAAAAGASAGAVGLGALAGLGVSVASLAAVPVVSGLAILAVARERGAGPVPAGGLAAVPAVPTAAAVLTALALVVTGDPVLARLGVTVAAGAVLVLAGAALARRILTRSPQDHEGVADGPTVDGGTGSDVVSASAGTSWRIAGGLVVVVALAGAALTAGASVRADLGGLSPHGGDGSNVALRDELRVAVTGDSGTPAALRWTSTVAVRTGRDGLAPGPTVADAVGAAGLRNRARLDALLRAVPPFVLRPVLRGDRGELVLGVDRRTAAEQAVLVRRLRDRLTGAPARTTAAPVGIVASTAEAQDRLEGVRTWLLPAAALLLLVAALLAWRDPRRAAASLAPGALGAGGAGLVGAASGVDFTALGLAAAPLVLLAGTALAAASVTAARPVRDVAVGAGAFAVGFLALMIADVPALTQLGLLGAFGVAVSAAVTVAVCSVAPGAPVPAPSSPAPPETPV